MAEKEYIHNFCINKDSFHRLYLDFYASLVVFATKLLGNTGEAEDVVQTIFIQTWESRKKCPILENATHYLYRSVKYRCLNELRNQKRHRLIEDDVFLKEEVFFENLYIEQETIRRIQVAISELPKRCQEIFIKSIDGLSNREIAGQLNIAEETVKKQKKIARKILKEKLGPLVLFIYFKVTSPTSTREQE